MFALLLGCSGNGTDILSIFFDGVHPPPDRKIRGQNVASLNDPEGLTLNLNLHPPYEEEACRDCHDPEKTDTLIKAVPALCFDCHEAEEFKGEEGMVHSPVEDGECVECHHPHKSTEDHLLRKAIPQTCFGCHEAEDFQALETEGATLHPPVEEGECIECHNPHKSSNKALLVNPVAETCFGCHEAEDFQALETEEATLHSPVEEGECIECHTPHRSEHKALLAKPVAETCFGCHEAEDFESPDTEEATVHSPVEDGECAECHSPHRSERGALLHKTVVDTCFGCHEEADLHEEDKSLSEKYPFADNPDACIRCHFPHASERAFLLREDAGS